MADPTQKRLLSKKEIGQVQTMSGLGMTVEEIALCLDISKKTLERRLHDQPELADALEKGRAKVSAKVKGKAFEMATSGKHPAMTIFWLKVREQWREAGIENGDININLSYNLEDEDGEQSA